MDVEANLNACRWGRLALGAYEVAAGESPLPEPFDVLVKTRISQLTEYQDGAYAEGYAHLVERACRAEGALGFDDGPFASAVATQLYRLMAIKDEYEVTRLHLSDDACERIAREFGPVKEASIRRSRAASTRLR